MLRPKIVPVNNQINHHSLGHPTFHEQEPVAGTADPPSEITLPELEPLPHEITFFSIGQRWAVKEFDHDRGGDEGPPRNHIGELIFGNAEVPS